MSRKPGERFHLTRAKRVYILPTRHGLILGAVLLAMLFAAINYNNSLAYMLCFLIASLALVSMVHTHYNLEGLTVQAGQATPTFAGGHVRLSLCLHNPSRRARYALYLDHKDVKPAGLHGVVPSIEAASSVSLVLSMPAPRRGRHRLQRLTVSTRYPLGLFRAWFWEPLHLEYLVYPHPYGSHPWPLPVADEVVQDEGDRVGGDDFTGVRAYQPGDSHRHVDWKAVARGRPMLIKQFSGGGRTRVWCDWFALAHLDTETRLSQLARWIVEADRQGCEYGLQLPHLQYPPTSGWEHYQACLKALALYGDDA